MKNTNRLIVGLVVLVCGLMIGGCQEYCEKCVMNNYDVFGF